MADEKKKKRKILKPLPKIVKMSGEEYWKLLSSTKDLDAQELRRDLLVCRQQNCELERQIATLKLEVYRLKLKDQLKEVENSKSDYDKIKIEIETKLGQSLNDCSIDPVNYTVHKGV